MSLNRKFPEQLDNPIDNLIINIGRKFYSLYYKIGTTPNHLTTVSFILGILSVYFFYKQHFIISSLLYFIEFSTM